MSNYKRAKKVVEQINNGEWQGVYNSISNDTLTITNGHTEIWVANLSFNCVSHRPDVDLFGLFWRHWVWFSAQKIRDKTTRDEKIKAYNKDLDDVWSKIDKP